MDQTPEEAQLRRAEMDAAFYAAVGRDPVYGLVTDLRTRFEAGTSKQYQYGETVILEEHTVRAVSLFYADQSGEGGRVDFVATRESGEISIEILRKDFSAGISAIDINVTLEGFNAEVILLSEVPADGTFTIQSAIAAVPFTPDPPTYDPVTSGIFEAYWWCDAGVGFNEPGRVQSLNDAAGNGHNLISQSNPESPYFEFGTGQNGKNRIVFTETNGLGEAVFPLPAGTKDICFIGLIELAENVNVGSILEVSENLFLRTDSFAIRTTIPTLGTGSISTVQAGEVGIDSSVNQFPNDTPFILFSQLSRALPANQTETIINEVAGGSPDFGSTENFTDFATDQPLFLGALTGAGGAKMQFYEGGIAARQLTELELITHNNYLRAKYDLS